MDVAILALIMQQAIENHIRPSLALAVVKVESNFNPNSVGSLGEIGLYQLRPEFSSVKRNELFNPKVNVREGTRFLAYVRDLCPFKDDSFVVCYNVGLGSARHITYPKKQSYYKKVKMAEIQMKEFLRNQDVFIKDLYVTCGGKAVVVSKSKRRGYYWVDVVDEALRIEVEEDRICDYKVYLEEQKEKNKHYRFLLNERKR